MAAKSTTPVPASFVSGTAQLFQSGKYSDLTIVCGTRSWKVHKSVITVQSEFFDKACDGQFKEAHENRIDLSEDDVNAVNAMLNYFYRFEYDASTSETSEFGSPSFHAKVFMVADKYMVGPLKSKAFERFEVTLMQERRNDAFADAVAEVYATTTDADHKLRRTIQRTAAGFAKEIFKEDGTFTKLKEVARKSPEFSLELAQSVIRGSSNAHAASSGGDAEAALLRRQQRFGSGSDDCPLLKYCCPRCSENFVARIKDEEVYRHACEKQVTGFAALNGSSFYGNQWRAQYSV